MFNYYRFIGCKYSLVRARIQAQCLSDNLSMRILESFNQASDDDFSRITVIVENDLIKDIFKS